MGGHLSKPSEVCLVFALPSNSGVNSHTLICTIPLLSKSPLKTDSRYRTKALMLIDKRGGNETARIFGSVTVRGEAISVRGDKSNKAP